MAVSADGLLSLSSAAQLRGATGLVDRSWGLLKLSNEDFMGRKLKLKLKPTQVQQKGDGSPNRKTYISLSLTADVATESKLRDLDAEMKGSRTVVAVILGGGAGTRLFPLTKVKEQSMSTLWNLFVDEKLRIKLAKSDILPLIIKYLKDEDVKVKEAAGGILANLALNHVNHSILVEAGVIPKLVPIGGSYRLIDVPMSNCINSGINKVYILTQFKSQSLNKHIARAYSSGNGVTFGDGFVEVLAATQTPGEGKSWFQGTADAVRQFHWLFEDPRSKDIKDVVILSGDHLYRMDYMDFVKSHQLSGADITLSCLPMDDSRASDFGLMKIDNNGRVLSFSEKPKGKDLKAMQVDTTVLGLSPDEAQEKPYIASMGVYVFKKEILLNLLRWRFPTANDFGSEVIPASAGEFYMKAYLFNDYWEDIGTIRSFFEANLALTEHPHRFSFYDAAKPIYTSRRNLPPTKIENCKIVDSIISHGSFLIDSFIEHSVVGIRSRINSNAHLKDTVMLGDDFYETDAEIAARLAEGRALIGIGENTKIKDCIIDKNARIGRNVVIANSEGIQEADRSSEGLYIRSGVTIILKNSVIEDGFIV